jgi:trk system potassium uptake protein TrkH
MATNRKEFAVIGLGRFGSNLALTLEGQGYSVLGIDQSKDLVQKYADDLTQTVALWSYVRRYPQPRIGNRGLETGTVRRAAAVLTVSALVVLMAAWLILITHPGATLDAALFEVISAFATCGLTLAFATDLNLFGQAVIMGVMFWGRLGALTIVTAIAQQQANNSVRIAYPEEQVLIG